MKKSKTPEIRKRAVFPVVESMEQAAGMTGATESIIRAAKRAGSKAFLTHGRIDLGVLIPDLFTFLSKASKLPDGIATPQDWLATEKAKREAIKRQQDEKSVIPTSTAIRHAGEAGGMFMSSLERLARELPPALAGLPVSGVAARMEHEFEIIRRNLKIKMAEIGA